MDGDLHDFREQRIDAIDTEILLKRIHDLRMGIKFILHTAEHSKTRDGLSKIAWKSRQLLKDGADK